MNRLRYILAVGALFTYPFLHGQQRDIAISGDFNDIPFSEFARQVEDETGVTIFYLEDWIKGIRVNVRGEDLSLRRTLDNLLLPVGIRYYLDENGNLFLTDRGSLVVTLPDYSGYRGENEGNAGAEDEDEERLTATEQKYIEGRSTGMLETILVGNRSSGYGTSQAVIHGKITDKETGEPLIGATIYVEELKKGAATDVDGRLSMVLTPGKYTVSFNCMGMAPAKYYMDVYEGGTFSVGMEKTLIPLHEVVVEASRYHNVRGTQMGFERLNYKVMKEVPVIMGEKDVLKVVQMLPGVQSVGEGAAGFNVRGSGADQNMIYVNKVPVYNSSHLFGFFSSFSPDIVKDFTLYKSNLPARYGGRLASFFDITTRQGNMNELAARGGISPITGHLAVEGPLKKDKSAFVLSARSTYSDWILNRLEDPDIRNSDAGFYDMAGAFTWEPGEKTLFKAFGYFSRDHFTLGEENRYAYSNGGGSLNLRQRMGPRLTSDWAVVYGEYEFETLDQTVPSESYSHSYNIRHHEFKVDFTWLSLGKHKITYGGNAIYYALNRGTIEPYGPYSFRSTSELGKEYGVETALYLGDEVSLLPKITLYMGLRYPFYMSLGPDEVRLYREGQPLTPLFATDTVTFSSGEVIRSYSGPEPRFSLNYVFGTNSSVKFSYNRLRQFLFMLSNTIAISPTDQWKLCDYHLSPPYVDQISVGLYHDVPEKRITTSLEIYHKWVHNVVEYRDGANFISSPFIESEVLQGDQKAYGLEAMVRKSEGKLNGWMSYSYSRSFISVDSQVPGESINRGIPYPSNFDRPHSFNLVGNFKVNRRLSFSSNLVYLSGRPVTYPVSIYYLEGTEYIDFSVRNQYRIPDYFRMDFSINIEGNLKERKLLHSFWMLNFYNLTGRKNAYSIFFTNENGVINGYKLSIFGRQVVTLSWNVKLGNYASE